MKTGKALRLGSLVEWKWRGHIVKGKIQRIYQKRIEVELRGARYVRNGSAEKPAYLILSAAGNEVLKLSSEVRRSTRL